VRVRWFRWRRVPHDTRAAEWSVVTCLSHRVRSVVLGLPEGAAR